MSAKRFKVTFQNDIPQNGETTSHPTDRAGCLRTVAELLEVAAKRATPVKIVVEVLHGGQQDATSDSPEAIGSVLRSAVRRGH